MSNENIKIVDAHAEQNTGIELDQELYIFDPEQVTFDNFKPDPDDQNTVTIFSVSAKEAEELGAMPSSKEELKTILDIK